MKPYFSLCTLISFTSLLIGTETDIVAKNPPPPNPFNEIFYKDRKSSFPFLSGDTLREACDYKIDEDNYRQRLFSGKKGQTVFVRGSKDMLSRFFKKYHPHIKNPYRLVTNNADQKAPGIFYKYLDDPKIIKWYAANAQEYTHPKLVQIPRGIPNRNTPYGNLESFLHTSALKDNKDRPYLLYMNFRPYTYRTERDFVISLFKDKAYCYSPGDKPLLEYLQDLTQAKFVLSPRGNGLDCYRTWEAMTMGAIPIVKTSDLDPMFKDLPVLIIEDWNQITEAFLNEHYEAFQKKEYNEDKIYAAWWLNLIKS